jgi:hypothetical protein
MRGPLYPQIERLYALVNARREHFRQSHWLPDARAKAAYYSVLGTRLKHALEIAERGVLSSDYPEVRS